ELTDGGHWPRLRMAVDGGGGAGFTFRGERSADTIYRVEESRGYEYKGALWSPGQFRLDLEPGQDATLILSTEDWDCIRAVPAAKALEGELERRKRLVEQATPPARRAFAAELVLAADQFIFFPAARAADAARARAQDDDGLLWQGAEGYQLTWMDAKVGDWVVTPRRGKAVEICALWYNALRLLEGWVREEEGDAAARPYAEHAEKAKASFNRRFWYEQG